MIRRGPYGPGSTSSSPMMPWRMRASSAADAVRTSLSTGASYGRPPSRPHRGSGAQGRSAPLGGPMRVSGWVDTQGERAGGQRGDIRAVGMTACLRSELLIYQVRSDSVGRLRGRVGSSGEANMILRPGPAGMLDFIKEVEERCSGKPRELSQREIGMRDAVAWVMGKQYSPLPGRPLDKNLLRNQ